MSFKTLYIIIICFILSLTAKSHYSKNNIDSLINILNTDLSDTTKFNTLYELTSYYKNINPTKEYDYADKLIHLSFTIKNQLLPDQTFKLAKAFTIVENFEQAIKQIHIAKNQFQKVHDSQNLTNSYIEIANNMYLWNQPDSATFYFNLADSLITKYELIQLKISYLNNYSSFLITQNNFGRSKELIIKAIDLSRETNNKTDLLKSYNVLYKLYFSQKKFAKSIETLNNAITIALESNNNAALSTIYINLGKLYSLTTNYKQAFTCYHKAIKINKNNNFTFKLSECYSNIGKLFSDTYQNDSALFYFNKQLETAELHNDKALFYHSYLNLSNYYASLKDYTTGLDYMKKYKAYLDSLNESELSKYVFHIQTKYETVNKRHELDILTKDNEIKSIKLNKIKYLIITLLLVLILSVSIFIFILQQRKLKANSEFQS